MPAAGVVDHGFGPQETHDVDLLGDAAAARVKVFAQGLVFGRVPADGDAEAQTLAGEDVDLGRLLGYEGCLALRQDDDAGNELNRPGDRAEIGEEDERLVEAAFVRVAAPPALGAVRGVGAEDVVVSKD